MKKLKLKIRKFFINIWWKYKNRNSELDGWKYYTPNISYKEDMGNFIRCLLIPELEFLIKYYPKRIKKFLKFIGSDKRFISKYLYDKGLK